MLVNMQMYLCVYGSLIDKPDVQRIILHMIDVAVWWSANGLCANRDGASRCTTMSWIVVQLHGPPHRIVLDGETCLSGRAASDSAETNRLNLKLKPVGSKAWITELHQQIHRVSAHATESQIKKEGISVPFEQTLATVTFTHNV